MTVFGCGSATLCFPWLLNARIHFVFKDSHGEVRSCEKTRKILRFQDIHSNLYVIWDKNEVKSFLAAVRFLTILPLPRHEDDSNALGRSIPFFPLVGLLIGLVVAALDYALGLVFPRLLTSGFTVVALIAVSGGLHIDGLADTADGFLSSRPRERVLEIMRDSRAGPMGVTAVVCVILLKFAALASIANDGRTAAVFLMPLAGRCALTVSLAILPYARQEGGLVTAFRNGVKPLHGLWAVCVLALSGWITMGLEGLVIAGVSLAVTLLFSAYSDSRIGGLTGDTLGATCELVELVPLLVAAAAT